VEEWLMSECQEMAKRIRDGCHHHKVLLEPSKMNLPLQNLIQTYGVIILSACEEFGIKLLQDTDRSSSRGKKRSSWSERERSYRLAAHLMVHPESLGSDLKEMITFITTHRPSIWFTWNRSILNRLDVVLDRLRKMKTAAIINRSTIEAAIQGVITSMDDPRWTKEWETVRSLVSIIYATLHQISPETNAQVIPFDTCMFA